MLVRDYIQDIQEKADSYERTIQTIISFDAAIRWNDAQNDYYEGSHFLPCRRLSKDSISGDDVTPDITIQQSDNYGIVAEVKMTASTEQDFANAYDQVKNYDRNLFGWKTANEIVDMHDISLLVNDLKRTYVKRYFEDKKFDRNFLLIACAHIREAKEYCKIEKYFGSFSNAKIEKKLSNPVPVPLESIVTRISNVKFYDADPSVEYTMNVLWMNVFSTIKDEKNNSENKFITVSCDSVIKILQERYSFSQSDSRQPKAPRAARVREALDTFVKINCGYRDVSDKDKYNIRYSYPRKDSMIEVFARKNFEADHKRKKGDSSKQLELL